ncbi:MAG: undecaprenyl-phosphate glucose phosphotransferase [Alphaproteobacteria bacterium]|nr:undecaprenyl-phosphate glucose phosphotransferase [Alphaproteobacteria bacterium]
MAESELTSAHDFEPTGARHRAPMARAMSGDIVQFIDFLLVVIASIGVAVYYHTQVILSDFDFQRYAAAGIVGATGITTLLRRDGYYEFERLVSTAGVIRPIAGRWCLVILGLLAFAFSLKISEGFSRFWLFAWTGSTYALLIGTRIVAAVVLRRTAREGGVFARRIALVGRNADAEKFRALAQSTERAISIVGVYDARAAADAPDSLSALSHAARNGEIDDIVIAMPDASHAEMNAIVARLSILPVSIAICANAHWLDHTGGEIVKIGSAPLLNLYRRPLEGWGSLLKTIEDKTLGTIAFILALPVLLIVAAAIRLFGGPGPVFFKQKRHGFNNEVFTIYKFRTMTVEEDGANIEQAKKNDPRVTPIGRILRRTSLDELPQLINVMKGEMSLVGPRPHALAHNHAYAQTIENYSGRHKMKPGITGWAQVNGYRGETSENEKMAERVRYDLEYIDNWSLWFDFKILALTVAAVLFPKNAY